MYVTHIEHKPFQWIHAVGSSVNRCDLDIFLFDDRALVVAGERVDDMASGMGISNGATILAAIVMQKYGVDFGKIYWIEHYPEKKVGNLKAYRMGEIYHRIRFVFNENRLGTSKWESLDNDGTRAFIEALKAPWDISD